MLRGGVKVGEEKMKIELVKADSNEFLNVTDATSGVELLMTRDKGGFRRGRFQELGAVLAMQDIAYGLQTSSLSAAGPPIPELCDPSGPRLRYLQILVSGVRPMNSGFLVKVTAFIHIWPP